MAKGEKETRRRNRRSPGRPPTHKDGELQKKLIDIAGEEFLASGYEHTRVQIVAEKAGISTRTFYKFIPNKADLFRMVAEEWLQRELQRFDQIPTTDGDGSSQLASLILFYSRLLLSPNYRRTAYIMITEMKNFPEILKEQQKVSECFYQAFDNRIIQLCESGKIDCPAPALAAEMLRTMISGLQRQIVFGGRSKDMSDDDVIQWSENCADLFLKGCGALGRK
nr:TetR/AcrR family transcriptional regulator [uncultured Cohaesibacter sp.]